MQCGTRTLGLSRSLDSTYLTQPSSHSVKSSRVEVIFPSFSMTLSHLSLQIRWADSTIRIRYRRVFTLFILPFSCLNVTAGLPKMLPKFAFIVAIGGELYFFAHNAFTRAHIVD